MTTAVISEVQHYVYEKRFLADNFDNREINIKYSGPTHHHKGQSQQPQVNTSTKIMHTNCTKIALPIYWILFPQGD